MVSDVSERRRHKRIPTSQRCWCESKDITLFGKITNASPQGAFIRTAAHMQEGEKARLLWKNPDGEQTVIDAEVVWVSGGDTGTEPGLGLRLLRFVAGEELWEALLQSGIQEVIEN